MKLLTLTLFFLAAAFSVQAQSPQWEWANEYGSYAGDRGQKIVHASGVTYVVGNFDSDTLLIGNDTLRNHGSGTADVFVAAYDFMGAPLWAINLGGSDNDEGLDIAYTSQGSGSIYITGTYSSDSMLLDTATIVNSLTATREMFLVKLTTQGAIQWAKDMGGPDVEEGRSLAADDNGNVFVTGGFRSSGIVFGTSALPLMGTGDVFILKYDANGNEVWAATAGGPGFQEGNGITLDYWGNIYITGIFYSDSVAFSNTILHNSGSADGFIAKYNGSGNAIWARAFGGPLLEESNAIAIEGIFGDLYITGAFESDTVAYGSFSIYNHDTANTRDVFVALYDTAGVPQLAEAIGGSGDETAYDLCESSFNLTSNIYVIGSTESPSLQASSVTLNTNGAADVFVLAYNSAYCAWGTTVGGALAEAGLGITSDNTPSFLCTGHFESPQLSFDTCLVTNVGNSDVFVARYRVPTAIETISSPGEEQLTIYPNPSTDVFTVALPPDAQRLTVRNVTGQVLITEELSQAFNPTYSLPLAGLYFVTVTTPRGSVTSKLLVNK